MDDRTLIEAFCAGRIPADAWTHKTHLRAGVLTLRADGWPRAVEAMKTRILRLNARHGTPETETRGYHHTITVAWLRVLLPEVGANADPSPALLAAHPEWQRRDYLFRFYSRPRLFTVQARRSFMMPDLADLPAVPDPLPRLRFDPSSSTRFGPYPASEGFAVDGPEGG